MGPRAVYSCAGDRRQLYCHARPAGLGHRAERRGASCVSAERRWRTAELRTESLATVGRWRGFAQFDPGEAAVVRAERLVSLVRPGLASITTATTPETSNSAL